MKFGNFIKLSILPLIVSLLFGLASCGVFEQTSDEAADNPNRPTEQEKSGAVLWGEHCNRCHGAPHAGEFSDREWEPIMRHMRIRANLTAKQSERIKDFLQGN